MFQFSCCLNQRKRNAKKSNPSSRLMMMLCREFFSSHEMSTVYSGEVQGNLIFPRNYIVIFISNVVYLYIWDILKTHGQDSYLFSHYGDSSWSVVFESVFESISVCLLHVTCVFVSFDKLFIVNTIDSVHCRSVFYRYSENNLLQG